MTRWEENADFAAALDACCYRVQAGEPLEQCLVDYPTDYRGELGRLVPMAIRVATLGRDPTLGFQARLERQILTRVAEERRRRQSGGLRASISSFLAGPVARIATIVAVVLVVLSIGGFGVVHAADNSLPGNPLYVVKEARESAALTFAGGGSAKVGVNASQISERGRELERAIQVQAPQRTVALIALRLAQATNQMVNLALELRAQGNPQPATRALVALQTMQMRLDVLIGRATPAQRPALERLRTFLAREQSRLEAGNQSAAPGATRPRRLRTP